MDQTAGQDAGWESSHKSGEPEIVPQAPQRGGWKRLSAAAQNGLRAGRIAAADGDWGGVIDFRGAGGGYLRGVRWRTRRVGWGMVVCFDYPLLERKTMASAAQSGADMCRRAG
jgi:hypothetical protein